MRFEVFQQAGPDAPFANVGSVHAPDPEIALQNARDVFVRRPKTHALWVVPADVILSRTAEQVATRELQTSPPASDVDKRFFVFRKTSQRRSMTFVTQAGELHAPSAEEALRRALQQWAEDEPTFVWWIVPADAVVAFDENDAPSLFNPAQNKRYRLPTEYHTQTMMRRLRENDDHD